MSKLETLTREDWECACILYDGKADRFAKTFLTKAKAMNLWPTAKCIIDPDVGVMAGIIVRISKRDPPVANLQLLHTFDAYRRRGLARELVEAEFARVRKVATYFRVSAEEDAVPFYRSLGFRFWGRQKSGSYLSMFRIVGPTISEATYDKKDPAVGKALFTKARGGLVEVFEDGAV